MLNIVLVEPEIPPNTGNIIRLCANTGANLHLIEPLGFRLDDSKMRRAGLDYHEFANLQLHADFASFVKNVNPKRIFACSTKGKNNYCAPIYQEDDTFLFGPETRGLSNELLESFSAEQIIRIPMLANSRSLNLSNAVAVILYEAYRQLAFAGLG